MQEHSVVFGNKIDFQNLCVTLHSHVSTVINFGEPINIRISAHCPLWYNGRLYAHCNNSLVILRRPHVAVLECHSCVIFTYYLLSNHNPSINMRISAHWPLWHNGRLYAHCNNSLVILRRPHVAVLECHSCVIFTYYLLSNHNPSINMRIYAHWPLWYDGKLYAHCINSLVILRRPHVAVLECHSCVIFTYYLLSNHNPSINMRIYAHWPLWYDGKLYAHCI